MIAHDSSIELGGVGGSEGDARTAESSGRQPLSVPLVFENPAPTLRRIVDGETANGP